MLKSILLLSRSQEEERAHELAVGDQESEVEETVTEETPVITSSNSGNSRH